MDKLAHPRAGFGQAGRSILQPHAWAGGGGDREKRDGGDPLRRPEEVGFLPSALLLGQGQTRP